VDNLADGVDDGPGDVGEVCVWACDMENGRRVAECGWVEVSRGKSFEGGGEVRENED
jgi:hypothetical protein